MITVHPSLFLFFGALLLFFSKGRLRQINLIAATSLALFTCVNLSSTQSSDLMFLGFQIQFLQVDSLSYLFGLVFSLAAWLGSIFALHLKRPFELAISLLYAGASLGVVYAGDWISFFIFWELMSVFSFLLIWAGNQKLSRAAGLRYFFVHAVGGGFLLLGILLQMKFTNSVELAVLHTKDLAFWCILIGIGINAAIVPLHAWLTDAYPEASVTGAVFLSVFTTKAAVYMLLRVFPGTDILIPLGVTMAVYGVVFAVLENDIRRLLAYHIVSQVGYMVTGIGIGTSMALSGSAAHAFCHILYKSLLFMGAGAVIYATGYRKLTELGGLGKKLFWVLVLYMVGGVSISGFPLFNGFISKSLVLDSTAQTGHELSYLLLTLASVGTFLHTGLKLPYFTFFHKNDVTYSLRPIPFNMYVAMFLTACFCLGLGVFPNWLYAFLPEAVDYQPYTFEHVASSCALLIGTGLAFFVLLKKLSGESTISLDTDWIYRKPLNLLGRKFLQIVQWFSQQSESAERILSQYSRAVVNNPYSLFGMTLRRPYDENKYRFPIAWTVFSIISVFAIFALALL